MVPGKLSRGYLWWEIGLVTHNKEIGIGIYSDCLHVPLMNILVRLALCMIEHQDDYIDFTHITDLETLNLSLFDEFNSIYKRFLGILGLGILLQKLPLLQKSCQSSLPNSSVSQNKAVSKVSSKFSVSELHRLFVLRCTLDRKSGVQKKKIDTFFPRLIYSQGPF